QGACDLPLRGNGAEQNSPAQRQRHGVGAIVGPELRDDAFQMRFGGLFRDRQLRADVFVGVAGGDEPQDLDFPLRKGIFAKMGSELRRHFRMNALLASVYRTNGVEQLLAYEAFEHVSVCSRFESTLREPIAAVSGQYDDLRCREFAAD